MGSACSNMEIIKTKYNFNDNKLLLNAYHYDIRKKYNFEKIINHGAYGKVKLYSDKIFNNMKLTVKTIEKNLLDKKQINVVRKEINFMNKLHHPCIIIYYWSIEDEINFHLIMEYCNNNNLSFHLKNNSINHETFIYIIFQILYAINYMHLNNIVHRDIKPANIIFKNEKFDLKIIDFGLSEIYPTDIKSYGGTLNYMPPEALKGEINPKNDIWSVGVIYYNYIYHRFPFNDSDKTILYKKIINDEIDYSFKNENMYENDVLLIKKMLEKDSNKRISAFEALNDPIFKNIKYGEEQNKLIEKFFSIDTINNIKKYVNSSILKKTFLYTYILFNQNELKNYYTKMFIALDTYFNKNQGFLEIELIFNEFLKKNLVKEEDKWTFLNIDLNNLNKFKPLNLNNLNDIKTNKIKIKDWGNIEYNIFLSFFVINEIKKENKNFEEKLFFIFNLFCDVEKSIGDEEQSFDSINLDDYILIINKNSFYNFLLKNGLSFKDANFCIDEFFDKYNKLNYLTFKSCICDEN